MKVPDYRLPQDVGNTLQTNFSSWVNTTWKSLFPWNTFALIIVQMVFFGVLISLSYKVFKFGWNSKTPEFH